MCINSLVKDPHPTSTTRSRVRFDSGADGWEGVDLSVMWNRIAKCIQTRSRLVHWELHCTLDELQWENRMAVSHSIDSFFRLIKKLLSEVQFYPDDLNQSLRADNTSLLSSAGTKLGTSTHPKWVNTEESFIHSRCFLRAICVSLRRFPKWNGWIEV